jgi:hypothetical protein
MYMNDLHDYHKWKTFSTYACIYKQYNNLFFKMKTSASKEQLYYISKQIEFVVIWKTKETWCLKNKQSNKQICITTLELY